MAYQMAATVMTLNDLQGHSPVAGLFQMQSVEDDTSRHVRVSHPHDELSFCSGDKF